MVATTKLLRAADRRDVHPMLQIIRQWFFGRPFTYHLRWREELSPRSQPVPNLPGGPAHRLSANYYHTRDNRRQYLPEIEVYNSQQKLLEDGKAKESAKVTKTTKIGTTPGDIYNPPAQCF